MYRIAFRLPDDGVWTGGINYLETVCRALLTHSDLGYEPVVFCNPDGDPALLTRFEALIGHRLIRDPDVAGRRRAGIMGALVFGRNHSALRLRRRYHYDVFMEAADFLGWRFPAACLVWVPDFQDRHLPHLFSRWNLWRKSLGLRLQLTTKRTILVSSEDARGDCERFYPRARGRIAVARFAVRPALQPGEGDRGIPANYGLRGRYFYLPNQYWVHKNHARVVDALRILRDRGAHVVVASSGNPRDPRQSDHYERLRDKVAAEGLAENFLFLGSIPSRDVAVLMRLSVAMVNPSLFEGWSTTVEEAKSLGARMVLSNLAVHREQAGTVAEFFDPNDPSAIAECLHRIWMEYREPSTLVEQRMAAASAEQRIREFAVQFTGACNLALDHFVSPANSPRA
jgi:glycosyltransferase involved in cell wall biosynthesis